MDQNRGNNNIEAIERLEKRYRDYFRHKAYKKPEKLSNYCYILAVKRSEKPMNGMHVYGQTIVETSTYYSKKCTVQ